MHVSDANNCFLLTCSDTSLLIAVTVVLPSNDHDTLMMTSELPIDISIFMC